MTAFLNSYMGVNRYLRRQTDQDLRSAFIPTIQLVADAVGERAFRPRRALNAAVFDAVMVGLAKRLARAAVVDRAGVVAGYEQLLATQSFIDATEKSTTDAESVKARLNLSTEMFSRVR